MIEYYMNFARGGVEMIWVENFANLLTKYPVPFKDDLDEYDTKLSSSIRFMRRGRILVISLTQWRIRNHWDND